MSNDEGRVEIYHDGEWGTICDDFWDVADATVVCRWLGYVRASKAKSVAFYGPGHNSQPIWLSNVNCTGEEDELSACDSSDWGDNRCSHQEDASVVCTNLSGIFYLFLYLKSLFPKGFTSFCTGIYVL